MKKKILSRKYIRMIKRNLTAFVLAIIILVFCAAYASSRSETIQAMAEVTNWGLSFQNEGDTPIGNASAEELIQYNSFFVGDTSEKQIYLTFDVGYENGHMPQILEVLEKHNVKATFFLVGNYLETEPELVKQMVEKGHIIGNHTWSHPDMSKISDEDSFKAELEQFDSKLEEITGEKSKKIYRPPQGKYSLDNLALANEMGYTTFFWSLAYVDWYEDDQPTKEEAFSKLLPRIHPGAIVLLHSTSATNAEILDDLLLYWHNLGYSFGDIEDLI